MFFCNIYIYIEREITSACLTCIADLISTHKLVHVVRVTVSTVINFSFLENFIDIC